VGVGAEEEGLFERGAGGGGEGGRAGGRHDRGDEPDGRRRRQRWWGRELFPSGDPHLASDDRIGRTKTTLLAAVLGGRHGETPQERARRRSCKWIVAAQASE
jgi:hypothetical protein